MNNDVAIKVSNVSKNFLLPHEKSNSLKSSVVNIFKSKDGSVEKQHALRDISFEIKKGEFFGIVGRNGSGKSTLLKILAGIYQPTKGRVEVNGRLVPFIELGVGFNPELTGRENVYLNGALLGFSDKEVRIKYDDIVSFAELDRFMDQKLKNYSSGMQVRLAFSVATVLAESDILLIDEVLAVGDADFQRKCFEYFRYVKKMNKTVVFVSHDMSAIREYCDRVALINDAGVEFVGSAEVAASMYVKLFSDQQDEKAKTEGQSIQRWGNKDVEIEGKPTVSVGEELIDIQVSILSKIEVVPVIGFSMENEFGQVIIGTNTQLQGVSVHLNKGKSKLDIIVPNILSSGNYNLTVAIHNIDGITTYDWWRDAVKVRVNNQHNSPYLSSPKCDFKLV